MMYAYAVSPIVQHTLPLGGRGLKMSTQTFPHPSMSAGSALNILLPPENFFGLSRWVLPCFVCQHAARLNPYSSLTKDWHRKRAVAKSKLPPGCIQFPITALQSKCYSVVIDLPKGKLLVQPCWARGSVSERQSNAQVELNNVALGPCPLQANRCFSRQARCK
jgi:hypothetical protein